jgi:hypothetical protein
VSGGEAIAYGLAASDSTPGTADGEQSGVGTQATESNAPGFGIVTAIVTACLVMAIARRR